MVIKEYRCEDHGPFECSDPICPASGCLSEKVEREFRTPPGIRSGMMKQHDAGIRGLSERMGGAAFRTATQEGDSSYGGHLAGGVKWGRDAEKFLGHGLTDKTAPTDAMKSGAAVSLRQDFVKHNMIPPYADRTQHKNDPQDRKRVVAE